MRNSLCDTLVNCSANPEFVFLTGDLGYNALEPLQASLGERFIIEPAKIPQDFLDDLQKTGHLFVVEEHIAHGGAGQMIARCLLSMGLAPGKFTHRYALGYVSGLYGSQTFHRLECGLDPSSIIQELKG